MPAAKILQIIPELKTGGAERSVVEMTEAIVDAGGEALIISAGGALEAEVEALGGRIIRMNVKTKNPLSLYLNSRKIATLIKREGISLVHARSRAPAWSGLWAARKAGVPFVTTYHGAYNQKSALKGFYNGVMARGDWVIANSLYTRGLILERHPVEPERVSVIYRGVDMGRLDPLAVSLERTERLREQWGVTGIEETRRRIVLHAARLTEWKGQRDVIEAAAQLKASGDERAIMVLAGDAQGRDAYLNELKTIIHSEGLTDWVKLVGHVDDMAAAYKLADVVVVASREAEAFGRAAAEAQAMGCPVIATDIGAPPEFLNLGERWLSDKDKSAGHTMPQLLKPKATAWLVPVKDGAAIAKRLQMILDIPPDEREELAEIARGYVGKMFTKKAMQEQTLGVYERLLSGVLATKS